MWTVAVGVCSHSSQGQLDIPTPTDQAVPQLDQKQRGEADGEGFRGRTNILPAPYILVHCSQSYHWLKFKFLVWESVQKKILTFFFDVRNYRADDFWLLRNFWKWIIISLEECRSNSDSICVFMQQTNTQHLHSLQQPSPDLCLQAGLLPCSLASSGF